MKKIKSISIDEEVYLSGKANAKIMRLSFSSYVSELIKANTPRGVESEKKWR